VVPVSLPLEDCLELVLRLWRGQVSHKRHHEDDITRDTQGTDRANTAPTPVRS
jgi:hypothetical protein